MAKHAPQPTRLSAVRIDSCQSDTNDYHRRGPWTVPFDGGVGQITGHSSILVRE